LVEAKTRTKEASEMKLARIIAPFSLSAVLFILSYISLKEIGSGFYSILLMIIGVALVVVGIAAILSDK
jgi:ABC-type nickel/cobalt efflux system permease component RcnA